MAKKGKKKEINKKKLFEWVSKHVNASNVRLAILFIPLLVLVIREIQEGKFVVKDFFDTGILVSFLTVFICEALASVIMGVVARYTEESVKLTDDYASLAKKYNVNKKQMVSFGEGDDKVFLPEIVLKSRKLSDDPFDINIIADTNEKGVVKRYNLPKQVADNSEKLFGAHKYSTIYNNLNIRLNDFKAGEDGKSVALTYGFTTYLDSMITNRAMDYKFKGGRTVREIYEPGPIISPLSTSKLSNHLGFNGFVELRDNTIVFIHRGKNVSIGKKTWSQSVGASLKTKYCLDEDGCFTKEKLSNAIRMEIADELKINISEKEDLCKSIFAFYRDLLEGGKPQFLFYYKTDIYDKEEFEEHFKKVMAEKAAKEENKKKQIVDGQEFEFFTIEQLRQCSFATNGMEYNGKEYKMVPSSVASVVMFINSIAE